MSTLKLLSLALVVTAISVPALAEEMMMKKGEAMMMMPDGKMATMPMDKDMTMAMMKDAKPMDHCMVMAMGEDGKMVTMTDMKMSNGMMACDLMMKK